MDPLVRRGLHASYCPQAPEDTAVLAQVTPFKILLRQPGENLVVANAVVGGAILRRQQLIVAHGLQLFDRIADEIRHPLVGANDAAILRRPKHRDAGEIEYGLETRIPLGENLVLALQRRGRVEAAAFKAQQPAHDHGAERKEHRRERQDRHRQLLGGSKIAVAERIGKERRQSPQERNPATEHSRTRSEDLAPSILAPTPSTPVAIITGPG